MKHGTVEWVNAELVALLKKYEAAEDNELVAENAALRTKVAAMENYQRQGDRQADQRYQSMIWQYQRANAESIELQRECDQLAAQLRVLTRKLEWHRARMRKSKPKKVQP